MKQKKLKIYTLAQLTDKHIGKQGTLKREMFDNELRIDLLREAIKQTRLKPNLNTGSTQ